MTVAGVLPRERKWPVAASPNQVRMFSASASDGGHPQIYGIWAVEGELDLPRLRAAWEQVLSRHAVLRAPLEAAGEGLLAVEPPPPGEAELSALRLVTSDAVRGGGFFQHWLGTEISAYRDAAGSYPGRCPPRLSVATDGAGHHLLLLALDHLVSDGKSMEVLARDLSRAYQRDPLKPARLDYYDWAVWDRRRRGSPGYRQTLARWRRALPPPQDMQAPMLNEPAGAGGPDPGGLPVAFIRREVADVRAVHRRARAAGGTPFMLALDAFTGAVREQFGAELRTVITSFHNRTQLGLRSLVGYFAHNGIVVIPRMRGLPLPGRIAALSTSVLWSVEHSVTSHREVRDHIWPDVPKAERYVQEAEVFFTYSQAGHSPLTFPGALVRPRMDTLHDFIGHYGFYQNGLRCWLEEEAGRVQSWLAYWPRLIDEQAGHRLIASLARRLADPDARD
jgi:condensation domain-containing protein